jgi:hypothetical protein
MALDDRHDPHAEATDGADAVHQPGSAKDSIWGPIGIPGLNTKLNIPTIALLLMLAGILLPSAAYSVRLEHPSPAELLVAICVALFAAVLFLWILDATSILTFRAPWISKAVYGAAIASILGTSVGVYKDYFETAAHPYEGLWHVVIVPKSTSQPVECSLVLSYSRSAGKYWGYSDLIATESGGDTFRWIELMEYVPDEGVITLRAYKPDGTRLLIRCNVTTLRKDKVIRSSEPVPEYSIELSRPIQP